VTVRVETCALIGSFSSRIPSEMVVVVQHAEKPKRDTGFVDRWSIRTRIPILDALCPNNQ
jgi:hypothetical protein